MTALLYKIPESLLAGYYSGQVQLVGALLKDVVSGQILGHVQQTGMLDGMLRTAMGGAQVAAGAPFTPLTLAAQGVSLWQNHQIGGQLRQVQASLGLLQNLQIGTLAVSGLGLGVSVVGFALMLRRLKAIEGHVASLGAQIEHVTRERRGDELRSIFTDIASDLDTVDGLTSRKDRQGVAQAAQVSLAKNARRLESRFASEVDLTKGPTLTEADLDLLWSLAAAIRLCHEAGARALFVIDEIAEAERAAGQQAARFLELSQALSPDALARLVSRAATDPQEMASLRRDALPKAQTLVTALRETVASMASQAELASTLGRTGIAGPDYLAAVETEDKEALLYLPVDEHTP